MQMTIKTQAVLAAFLSSPSEPRYGLEIARAAGLGGGTLYPILARLESAGWLESEWEQIDPVAEGRRPRRYYKLTGEGESAAREALRKTYNLVAPVITPGLSSATT